MGEISREGAKLVSEAPREGEAATGKSLQMVIKTMNDSKRDLWPLSM
jgi:hypothetical protein